MEASKPILADHPVNRKTRGRRTTQGTVDLALGAGEGAGASFSDRTFRYPRRSDFGSGHHTRAWEFMPGLERIVVPGITGFLDTNYRGKGEYGVNSLEKNDLVFIHVEATDEAGHMGDVEKKIQAIEDFDEKVVGTVLQKMSHRKDWRVLLMPDHPTSIALKTHVAEPVPFVLYSAGGAA